MEDAKVKAVSAAPEVKIDKKKMVTIFIDPEMVTMQGIRINGKMYIGKVTVTEEQAEDLLRIQSEFWETRKKLLDRTVHVRMKSDHQKEALFLVDPKDNEGKKGFTRDYGLLGALEWSYCSPAFKARLLELRMQMYGY